MLILTVQLSHNVMHARYECVCEWFASKRRLAGKMLHIKMYVSQNGINILGHDGQTNLNVSIDAT